eukprot:s396_g11.t1
MLWAPVASRLIAMRDKFARATSLFPEHRSEMVTRITPVFVADGTGRDTYILLDKDFKKGFRQPPFPFALDLRSATPRGPHSKGYQRWFTPSRRTMAYSPKIQAPLAVLPSKASGRSSSAPHGSRPREAWSNDPRKKAFNWRDAWIDEDFALNRW